MAQLLEVLSSCIWINHYDKKFKLHYLKQRRGTITPADIVLFTCCGLPMDSEEPRKEKSHG